MTQLLVLPNSPDQYKLHLACWNGEDQPLDVFVRSRDEWNGWNRYRGTRDDFSRPFIFALIDYYPEPHTWLFGGIFAVKARRAHEYVIALDEATANLIGRLKVSLRRPARAKAVYLEKYLDSLVVRAILPEPYSGQAFPGYERINAGFRELEAVFKAGRPDWRAALENVKGVYLITDTSNGRRYVGAAYGDSGVWSRWRCYIDTGHGWTDELTRLIKKRGIAYARENFRFSLLEYRSMRADDGAIIEREKYWKDVLLTRGEHGYNGN